jgi:hypothetical protein
MSVVSGVSSVASLGDDKRRTTSNAHLTDASDAHMEDFEPLCITSGVEVAHLVVCHLTRPMRLSENH